MNGPATFDNVTSAAVHRRLYGRTAKCRLATASPASRASGGGLPLGSGGWRIVGSFWRISRR